MVPTQARTLFRALRPRPPPYDLYSLGVGISGQGHRGCEEILLPSRRRNRSGKSWIQGAPGHLPAGLEVRGPLSLGGLVKDAEYLGVPCFLKLRLAFGV